MNLVKMWETMIDCVMVEKVSDEDFPGVCQPKLKECISIEQGKFNVSWQTFIMSYNACLRRSWMRLQNLGSSNYQECGQEG